MSFTISTIATTPFEGQQTGTSGLRKKVSVVRQANYIENWLESLFQSVKNDGLAGSTLIVGGDGRYWNSHVIQVIFEMAAAHHVSQIFVGQNGLLSTPAVSSIIRRRKAFGGIILTASHNPGGPENDFGIKYNIQNGGPAPESVTGKIYEHSKSIKNYLIANDLPAIDVKTLGERVSTNRSDPKHVFRVTVIDSVEEYLSLLKTVFDFTAIKSLFQRKDFKFAFDGLHGVSGPYAKRIFVQELGAPPESLANCDPKEDFGGHHPDPNLTYAADLVALMKAGAFDFGAASDGDADRNMVLGKNFFVNPSDSVAVIVAHANRLPAYNQLRAVARSMPTSAALDRVAKELGLELFEVPTGWKYFGNIMDAFEKQGAPLGVICGEESFGTGSSHIREKDGLWSVMAWLSIVAMYNNDKSKSLVSVESIVRAHWQKFGRNVFSRYDYEGVSSESAQKVMDTLYEAMKIPKDTAMATGFQLASADDFEYKDTFDSSGIRFVFADGSRFVMRLSGTGSSGATVRLYAERFLAPDAKDLFGDAQEMLKPVIQLALQTSQLEQHTGRTSPTVIT